MKTVFDNRQLAHVWAQQTQPTGRSQSMHFDGPTIYSYKTPIAKFYDVPAGTNRVCLITSESYSVTTSGKHMPAVRRALAGDVRTFSVPHVIVAAWERGDKTIGRSTSGTHQMNLDALLAQYDAIAPRLERARDITYLTDRDGFTVTYQNLCLYAVTFGLPQPFRDPNADWHDVIAHRGAAQAKRETPAYLAAQARKAELAAAKEAKRAAERIVAEMEARAAWFMGERAVWFSTDEKGGAYLRLSNDGTRVETSQGAHIPVVDARRIIPLIRACKEAGEVFEPYDRAAYAVGSFQVNHIAANGDIKAGCHFIQFAEIDKIGKLLGV